MLRTKILGDIRLENIKVENFKSFNNIDLNLGSLNVLIGANASGKSNFTQIFNFLHDITVHGLDNAISLQGGIEFLRNFKNKPDKNLVFELSFSIRSDFWLPPFMAKKTSYVNKLTKAVYRFEIKLGEKSGFQIIDDHLKMFYEFKNISEPNDKKWDEKIIIYKNKNKFAIKIDSENKIKMKEKDFHFFPDDNKLSSKELILNNDMLSFLLRPQLGNYLRELIVYDFDPKLAKKLVDLKGKIDLENDGSNLAIVLKDIIENKEQKRKFINLITELLPFIRSVEIEKSADKSILFKLTEIYFKNQQLPSSLISDGTVNMTAVILALFFQEKSLIIIEEPEKNIHPSLIVKLVEIIKDASKRSQIILTTHNPELIRHMGIENIYLVSRDDDGFSDITKPQKSLEVKKFLKHEMQIEELYVQNLLGD